MVATIDARSYCSKHYNRLKKGTLNKKSLPEMSPIERFYDYVPHKPLNECWIWRGYLLQSGYGSIMINRKQIRAHRFSYILFNGEIPYGYEVCHTCDNPPCVNPSHLFAGTAKDNAVDRQNKNRGGGGRGEKSFSAKFNNKSINEIKLLLINGMGSSDIAKKLNVSYSAIYAIKSLRRWRDVSPELNSQLLSIKSHIKKGQNNPNSKLSNYEVKNILIMLGEGITGAKIARNYKVSPRVIYLIRDRKSYNNIAEELSCKN